MIKRIDSKLTWNGKTVKVKGKKVVGKSSFEMGIIIEGQAEALAPVDTGRLRGSITTQSRGDFFTGNQTVVKTGGEVQQQDIIDKPSRDDEVLVGTALFYAPYLEYGTVRSGAQPFMRPALDLAMGKTLTITQKNGRAEFKDYLK